MPVRKRFRKTNRCCSSHVERIEELNTKVCQRLLRERIEEVDYNIRASKGKGLFFFFIARAGGIRGERLWMGYERKRGKLYRLERAVAWGWRGCFLADCGRQSHIARVKYVITLDTDTQLPRNSARQFVGTMAHPLNQPRLAMTSADGSGAIVTEGYGILQPRVGVSLSSTNRSIYAWLFGGEAGIDPYTRISSDVYQDLFHEGSFVGKGIYDVDAFETALCARFPENRILSHDLLEGCYARSGLLSDVELYEEFPSGYLADVSRRHRWIRGDWQLATWMLWRVPTAADVYQANPLSALSKWKLMDNLRRSLVPASSTLLLIMGWIAMPDAWFWTMVVIAMLAIPAAIPVLTDLLKKPAEVAWRQQVISSARSARRHFGQILFTLACLPYEAYFSLDAIVRTHVRLFATHRRLLEWDPSREVERASDVVDLTKRRSGISRSFRPMWIAPAIAILGLAGIIATAPFALLVALPILLLSAASPAIAWRISRPHPSRSAELSVGQMSFLASRLTQDVVLLRNFHRPRRSLASAR